MYTSEREGRVRNGWTCMQNSPILNTVIESVAGDPPTGRTNYTQYDTNQTDYVWTPTIEILNEMMSAHNSMPYSKTVLGIQRNGLVKVNHDVVLRTMCELDLAKFPWDTQHCSVKLVSATVPGAGAKNSSIQRCVLIWSDWYSAENSAWSVEKLSCRLEPVGELNASLAHYDITVRRYSTFDVCLSTIFSSQTFAFIYTTFVCTHRRSTFCCQVYSSFCWRCHVF